MNAFDLPALRQGALLSLVVAVPFSVGSRLVADNDSRSAWASLMWLVALVGFVLGAGVAAWVQTKGMPLAHGLVCAGGTYLAAQLVFVIVKLARGSKVHWLAIFFTFTAVLLAGLAGGGLGSMLQRQGIMPGRRGHT